MDRPRLFGYVPQRRRGQPDRNQQGGRQQDPRSHAGCRPQSSAPALNVGYRRLLCAIGRTGVDAMLSGGARFRDPKLPANGVQRDRGNICAEDGPGRSPISGVTDQLARCRVAWLLMPSYSTAVSASEVLKSRLGSNADRSSVWLSKGGGKRARMPAIDRLDEPLPIAAFSSSVTSKPRAASRAALNAPLTPPPMIATRSGRLTPRS